MTLRLSPGPAERRELAAVATGRRAADLVFRGGALVDVFTDEILEGWGVAVVGERVATVGPDASLPAGPGTRIIELDGRLVAPGLVEGHTHLIRASLREQVAAQVQAGVTTTFVETLEPAYVAGPGAVRALLAEAATVAGRAFLTLGGLVVPDGELEARLPGAAAWAPFLDDPLVAGTGEIYWAEALRGHARTEGLIEAALERGLTVEGHGAGARHPSVAALAALGATADHEGIDADDVQTRLRLGLWTEARHGATRQDLDAIAGLWQEGGHPDLRRLALVCDGVEPEDLAAGRTLNAVVDHARELGLPTATAIRMASLSPAERFSVGRWIGGLAPGALADIQVLPRHGPMRPDLVLVGGRPPEEGPFARPPVANGIGEARLDDRLLAPLGPGPHRAMRLAGPTVTREAPTDGEAALWVIALDREDASRGFRGLLLDSGLARGAVAWSSGWEAAGPVVAGTSAPDVRLALSRLGEIEGGAVVVAGGRILAEWRAPLFGFLSPEPLTEVAREAAAVNTALRELGAATPNPLLTLETLTTAAIPFLRITPSGYYRARDGSRPGLRWDGGTAAP